MALTFASKPSGSTYRYTWTPPIADGDSLSAAVLAIATGTAVLDDYSIDGNDVILALSGGAVGETTTITAEADTSAGEVLTETLYIPIRSASNAFTYTARDAVYFALRKIVGNGNDPEAIEADDALERLNDMLALWRIDGLDIGIAGPFALGDTLKITDEYISAVKFNLRIACHDHYDAPITAYDADMAERTKRLVANQLLSFSDLSGPRMLSVPTSDAAFLV